MTSAADIRRQTREALERAREAVRAERAAKLNGKRAEAGNGSARSP